MLITENQLDQWVRSNARDAQGVIVELVARLVAVSTRPKERRFPLGDSIGQHGPDGVLDVDFPFYPFIPEGRSFWEIGTNVNAAKKATSDYKSLVDATPEDIRRESAFVFVTPLSGRRDWKYTWEENGWEEDAQEKWLKARQELNDWREVCIIDGTKLIDWLHQFPSVELWLAKTMNRYIDKVDTLNNRWNLIKTIGEPPLLTPHVFLVNRDFACAKLKEVFDGNLMQLKLSTYFPDQVVNFVSAYVANMDEDEQLEVAGRTLVISDPDTWNAIVTHQLEKHFLVSNFDLDLAEETGNIIEKALRAGHAVIFGGIPGGIPHPSCESIPSPNIYQIKEALEKAGHSEERARVLAQKSGGDLSSLLRCLRNLSIVPEWAQKTPAAELAIAEMLGSWNENSDADRVAINELSGNFYGEWIGKMREVALRPGTPLTQRDGIWKFVARYEGWYALGSRLYDEHLDRLLKVAVNVLSEKDPKFELPQENRYAAAIYGKVLSHSSSLRKGLAETLALLGSHPNALISCSSNKAETTATLAVRGILNNADWVQWGSLNDLLPLLAEAAPGEFLDAVDNALSSTPCPFDELFAQEDSGAMGANYMSGMLWALETLAWDAEFLTRVVMILGELAVRDPGGNWGNRPTNTLTTILLPWLPQTCASIELRKTAVSILLDEFPNVGWNLLLSLIPESHKFSNGSRRPSWRMIIPDDWPKGVTLSEYEEQITFYLNLAINSTKSNPSKLVDLINRLEDLPLPAVEQLLICLESDSVSTMPVTDRFHLWTKLQDVVKRNRKYTDTTWAMKPEQVDKIAEIVEKMESETPEIYCQQLFSDHDFDLYEEKAYEDQQKELDIRRQTTIRRISVNGGTLAVLDLASEVQSPWRVGIAFGTISDDDTDKTILPELLDTEQKSLAQFAGGFVLGKFRCKGWEWVNKIDTSQWSPIQIGQFLSYLPFAPEAWELSRKLMGEDESPYWTRTNANPYETDESLEVAIDSLVKHGRPYAAINCLHKMQYIKQSFDNKRAVGALLAAPGSSENVQNVQINQYEIIDIIKALQDDPNIEPEDLLRVEGTYLPLLDHHSGASPKFLERQLADEPRFFCEIIRLVFRSKNETETTEELTEQVKRVATNAYRLLSGWRTPPGCLQDGSYDGDALGAWLGAVKKECTETGHFEVAMSTVGQVLIYTPADPEGLWIHRSAAQELNKKDVDAMRKGFNTGLYNSRGVHDFTKGKEEQELANKYRSQAEAVETEGFYRLATTLRELAISYEHESKKYSSRDLFED